MILVGLALVLLVLAAFGVVAQILARRWVRAVAEHTRRRNPSNPFTSRYYILTATPVAILAVVFLVLDVMRGSFDTLVPLMWVCVFFLIYKAWASRQKKPS